MFPRRRLNFKTILKIIVGMLVVVAIVFCMFAIGNVSSMMPSSGKTDDSNYELTNEFKKDDVLLDEKDSIVSDQVKNGIDNDEEKTDTIESINDKTESNDQVDTNISVVDENDEDDKDNVSVANIWNKISITLDDKITADLVLSIDNVSSLYGIDKKLISDYIFVKSGTAVTPEEYLIVKVSESTISVVEQACLSRQQQLLSEWKDFGINNLSIINNYQMIRCGDYLLFGISENISQIIGLFQGMMM